ncbi:ribosomal RNA processing protein 1 homolog [Chenopodium quinoa]|uniref:ribosomal RNA processing protein 1 homolog n=1 Tax=Chenopodium quinoa TaxID=63459 RepID=UPI000B77885A|nr:ribosomal RNA processing protein 1 homolog [Chenopodium quinoa]
MAAEEPLAFTETTLSTSLIKGLASCDTSVRSKSLKTILNWLSSQTLVSDDEFKKLWKALFYCMWHCDMIENQTQLINRLSTLLPILPYPLSLSYFSHFLLTMRKEWPGIDHLRLDKFYLLIRFFVRNLFVLLKELNWDLSVLGEFVGVLEKKAFFFVDDEGKGDNGLGNGVTYHIVSVFCDEIKPFLPLNLEVLNLLFRPFVGVLSKSDNKVLVGKVKSNVFGNLIKNGKGLLVAKKSGDAEVDEKGEMILFGTIGLAMGYGTRFYELGSAPDCLQGNRKVIFGLQEEFSKLEKEKAALGIEVSLPEVDGEVPVLVSSNGDVNGVVEVELPKKEASKEKKSKKKKKKNEVANPGRASGNDSNGDTDMVNISVSSSVEVKDVGNELEEKKSKKKKKKNQGGASGNDSNGDIDMVNISESSNAKAEDGGNALELELNEDMMSNLQKQFEKIAAESGLDGDGLSALDSPKPVQVSGKPGKKRKRSKSVANADTGGHDDIEKGVMLNTEEKSGKRVRFAMKNNIVWKPHNPLPPQNVRIPPSSTPRGSALKKGVSPGPIRDSSLDAKKKKRKPSPLKKSRKVKSISPSVKRVKKKKVKSLSA